MVLCALCEIAILPILAISEFNDEFRVRRWSSCRASSNRTEEKQIPTMKKSVLSLALASLAFTINVSVSAAVPDLTVRLDRPRHDVVVVSANVPTNSTWILEGSNNPNGTWSPLVTLKPSGFQITVSNAPQFLRLHRGNEIGSAVAVFRTDLGVELVEKTVVVFPVCPLPPGRWILQQTSDLKQWTDRAAAFAAKL